MIFFVPWRKLPTTRILRNHVMKPFQTNMRIFFWYLIFFSHFCVVCIKIVSGKTFKFLRFFCMRQLTDCLSLTKYDCFTALYYAEFLLVCMIFSKVCFLYVCFTALCSWWVMTQHQHPGVWGCSIQNWIFIVKVWLKFSTLRRTFSFQQKSTDNNDAFSEFFDASTFHWPYFIPVFLSRFTCVSCDVCMSHFLIVWWRKLLRYQGGCVPWI